MHVQLLFAGLILLCKGGHGLHKLGGGRGLTGPALALHRAHRRAALMELAIGVTCGVFALLPDFPPDGGLLLQGAAILWLLALVLCWLRAHRQIKQLTGTAPGP